MLPPDDLNEPSVERWHAFFESDVAQLVHESDLPRLRRWILATDELDRVRAVLVQTRLVRGSTGQPVLNPLAQYVQQLEAEIERAEQEFGMTPAARLRLLAESGAGSTNDDDEFAAIVARMSSPLLDTED